MIRKGLTVGRLGTRKSVDPFLSSQGSGWISLPGGPVNVLREIFTAPIENQQKGTTEAGRRPFFDHSFAFCPAESVEWTVTSRKESFERVSCLKKSLEKRFRSVFLIQVSKRSSAARSSQLNVLAAWEPMSKREPDASMCNEKKMSN